MARLPLPCRHVRREAPVLAEMWNEQVVDAVQQNLRLKSGSLRFQLMRI